MKPYVQFPISPSKTGLPQNCPQFPAGNRLQTFCTIELLALCQLPRFGLEGTGSTIQIISAPLWSFQSTPQSLMSFKILRRGRKLAENPSGQEMNPIPGLGMPSPPSHALPQMSYPMAKLPPAARVKQFFLPALEVIADPGDTALGH